VAKPSNSSSVHAGRLLGGSTLFVVLAAACHPPPPMGSVRLDAGCQDVTSLDGRANVTTTVRWLGPDSPDDVRTLTAWCARVGPALIQPSGTMPFVGDVTRIAVVSWNVHLGRGDLVRLLADLWAGRLTDGEPVQHFVLLLQEVVRDEPLAAGRGRGGEGPPDGRGSEWDRPTYHDIAEWGGDLGLAVFYAPSMRNDPPPGGRNSDRGNAILSTLPLSDLRIVNLPFERQRRAALVATVQTSDATGGAPPVRVVALHLDVWPALLPSLTDPTRRFRQAAGLLESLDADSVPLLLGGDFNTASVRDPLITHLRKQFPESVLPASCRTRNRFCPDFIFQRLAPAWSARPYRILDDMYGSDHRPLVMVISRESVAPPSSAAR
jgi:endonuclease/exonuclease/phosphatase family metal-dependent hydrolase